MNHVKSYLGHYLTYGMGAILVVLGFAQTYGGLVPKWGPVIVGGAGILIGALDQISKMATAAQQLPAPTAAAVAKQSGEAYPAVLAVLAGMVAILALVLSSACSTLQSMTTSPTSTAAVQAAVDLGVGTYIQETAKTPADQTVEATQISAIASALEAVLSGDTTTLAQLDQVLNQKIAAANLNPADKAAAAILAQTLQAIVLQELQSTTSNLSASNVVAVKAILDDVIQAASFYGAHARAVIHAQLSSNRRASERKYVTLANADAVCIGRCGLPGDRCESGFENCPKVMARYREEATQRYAPPVALQRAQDIAAVRAALGQ